jgi:DNA polymerase III delta subunit
MLNKTLEKEFKDGLKAPIYFFWGEDNYLLEDVHLRSIDKVLSDSPVDFNYDLFYPSASSQQIIDAVSTLPFMAGRRLVVLKDFHEFPEATIKEIMPYLQMPSESTCMVVLSRKAPKKGLDIRWRVYHLSIREKDMPVWVKELSSRKGVRLTNDVINILLEFTGYDTGLLSMEIEKLANSGKKIIKEADVIASITMMRHFTSFELINCIIEGQKTRALRILRSIFREGNATESATLLLGALNWHFREFYNLWLDKGRRPARMKEKTYKALMKYLPLYNEERFYDIFRALHEADIRIKTGGRAEIVIEALLINLLLATTEQDKTEDIMIEN